MGWVFSLIATLLWLLVAAMVILGIVHAAKGERTPLPVIGKLFTFLKYEAKIPPFGGIL